MCIRDSSPYSAQVSGPEDFAGMSVEAQMEKMVHIIKALDSGVDQLSSHGIKVAQDIDRCMSVQTTMGRMIDSKIGVVKREIGSKNQEVMTSLDERQNEMTQIGPPICVTHLCHIDCPSKVGDETPRSTEYRMDTVRPL